MSPRKKPAGIAPESGGVPPSPRTKSAGIDNEGVSPSCGLANELRARDADLKERALAVRERELHLRYKQLQLLARIVDLAEAHRPLRHFLARLLVRLI